jgi:hypothetical protein
MRANNIEDLVTHICEQFSSKHILILDQRDKTFLFSLSSQFKKSLALTANQATLLMKILKEKKNIVNEISDHSYLIENPVFKYPFRTVDMTKTISLITYSNELCISIKFPYDRKMRDTVVGLVRGRYGYNKNSRSYVYPFSIENLYNILINDNIRNYGFDIHESIKNLYEKITKIKDEAELHKPLLDYNEDLVVKNSNKLVTKYFEDNKKENILHNLFLGKTIGLTPGKKLIEKINSMNFDTKIVEILLDDHHRFAPAVNSTFDRSAVVNFLKSVEQYPILFILEDDQRLHNSLSNWHRLLSNVGIENSEISVLSRSADNQNFNTYIKDHQLNNLVADETKVVFIKNKIPKVLYKIDFKPKIVVSMSTFYVHFSTQRMLDSHPFIMFYTDQSLDLTGKKIAKL